MSALSSFAVGSGYPIPPPRNRLPTAVRESRHDALNPLAEAVAENRDD